MYIITLSMYMYVTFLMSNGFRQHLVHGSRHDTIDLMQSILMQFKLYSSQECAAKWIIQLTILTLKKIE